MIETQKTLLHPCLHGYLGTMQFKHNNKISKPNLTQPQVENSISSRASPEASDCSQGYAVTF